LLSARLIGSLTASRSRQSRRFLFDDKRLRRPIRPQRSSQRRVTHMSRNLLLSLAVLLPFALIAGDAFARGGRGGGGGGGRGGMGGGGGRSMGGGGGGGYRPAPVNRSPSMSRTPSASRAPSAARPASRPATAARPTTRPSA